MANTSPGRIVSAGMSASRKGTATESAMLFMSVVAIECAMSRPSRSRIAADASEPSTMKVEYADRTTTMLASSAATTRALRSTSAVSRSPVVTPVSSTSLVTVPPAGD